MPENRIEGQKPLWMLIEKDIQKHADEDFSESKSLETSRKIAAELDGTGYNVSKSGGNWLQLQEAVKARRRAGHPFMQELDEKISAFTLDDLQDTRAAAMKTIIDLSKDWPFLSSEHRADLRKLVSDRKTELTIAKAKELGGETGIRYLITESFEPPAIIEALGISEEEYKGVKSKVDAELAEKKRVKGLFAEKEDASEEDKIKHLLNHNASDELIKEIGNIDQSSIDVVKKAMEQELAEKKRKEEELAAKKAAEAAGPALEDISPDDMLGYIEGIREILEFSDVEKDIRTMCEQSSIPKVLVDIAVSSPDRLGELEKQAEG